MRNLRFVAVLLLALVPAGVISACSSLVAPGTPAVNPTQLTPREVMYGLEVAFTAAVNSANQVIAQNPTLPESSKAAIGNAFGQAVTAMNAAETATTAYLAAVATTPVGGAAPNQSPMLTAVQAAQTAVAALQAAIAAAGQGGA